MSLPEQGRQARYFHKGHLPWGSPLGDEEFSDAIYGHPGD
jgi:hypothetical protein